MKFLLITILMMVTVYADSTSVTLNVDGSTVVIHSIVHRSMVYIQLKSVAEKLQLRLYENSVNGKIELKGKKHTARFTQNNPFMVVTGGVQQEVIQLPVSVIFRSGELYAPAVFILDVLQRISGKSVAAKTPLRYPKTKPTSKPKDKKAPENIDSLFAEKNGEKEASEKETTSNIDKQDSANTLMGVSLEVKKNGELVKVAFTKAFISFTQLQKGNLFTLRAKLGVATVGKVTFPDRLVKSVSVKKEADEIVIQLQLSKEAAPVEVIKQSPKILLFSVRNKSFGKKTEAKKKYKFDTIVLDAGHGGKDFGAIGYEKATEKIINLAVALKLGELIKKELPEIKVIYTRDDDTFVELFKRGQIANKANGKLFVSIHCNSVAGKKEGPNGYEVYLLRPGRTKEAISIAERENAVISYEENPSRYEKLTDENFILVSMAHAAHMKFSEMFAETTERNMKKQVAITSRGIKQAGFYVLVGASMPSILFEIGYITNPNDSKIMKSKEGQGKIAKGLLESIKEFKELYEAEMELE